MAIGELLIGDVGAFVGNKINEAVTKLEFSWTLDLVSEMSFEVVDKDLFLWNRNSFLIRRDAVYRLQGSSRNDVFEMSSIGIRQDQGYSPVVSVKARKKSLQLMKRDKNPESYGGSTATEFAASVAQRFGLGFVGERTSKSKVIAKSSGSKTDDSVYDVLKRSASEANFIVFESDNVLYFASEQWLLGKWANVTISWPNDSSDPFYTFGMPECQKSDDDPYGASFKVLINRQNGKLLRPGMTVILRGINSFDGQYLISEVSFEDGTNSPVSVSCRTPVKPREEQDG